MLRLLAVFAACLGLSHAGINYLDCNTYTYQYGSPGDDLHCPDGYLLTEFCSSGATDECDGFHSYIRCCRHDGYTDDTPALRCYESKAFLGTKHDCFLGSGDYVAGLCGSGDGGSLCGLNPPTVGSATVMKCCVDSFGIGIGSQCRWVYGDYGQTISCGDQVQEAIIGSCTSGSTPVCDGRSHAIHCCDLL